MKAHNTSKAQNKTATIIRRFTRTSSAAKRKRKQKTRNTNTARS